MSKWKDSKTGNYYRLYLDRDTKVEEATMYRKIVDGTERYTYMVSKLMNR